METALDPLGREPIARRCGVTRTTQVDRRTTALLVRFRYHIVAKREEKEIPLLAEDCRLMAFAGTPQKPEWLDEEKVESLLTLRPGGNIQPEQARDFASRVTEDFGAITPYLEKEAYRRGDDLLNAHHRVRRAARLRNVQHTVVPQLPADVLGIYIYLPLN
jgi:hypothetical protein